MQAPAPPRLRRVPLYVLLAASAALLAACATPQPKMAMVEKKTRSKEYFAETEYGVKASPRVFTRPGSMQRGGGRDQVGKPYKVRGKWYYPKEDRKYAKTGTASWYGDAFHGRLTANGEVYDMEHLTAAHPTMPLPSYARVTNLDTGSSVIVRVNDRGPYAEGRIIDVSKRAAEMLDYAKVGTAKVKVEYVGRAPLDGHDDQYLMASYHPGNRKPDPSDGLPTGVMVAMNGPTPSLAVSGAAVPFPGQLTDSTPAPVQQAAFPVEQASFSQSASAPGDIALPDFGPIVPERPDVDGTGRIPFAVASLSYADERVERGAGAFGALAGAGMSPTEIIQSWKRLAPPTDATGAVTTAYIAAGSYETAEEAGRIASELSSFGKTEVEQSQLDGKDWYSVNLYPNGHGSLDDLLQAAWTHGAPDALAVRD